MKMNLESYKIFYFVAKCKSITAAAEKLCISQPAVSQSIKQLEKGLGCELFLRTSKGVELTEEGKILFFYVEKGYDSFLMGEAKLEERLNFDKGYVRIGASDMTLQFYLLPFLEKFHEKYPNIKVIVTNGPPPDTLNHLYQHTIDFGIVSSPFEKKEEVHVKKVKEIEDIFVAGSRFLHLKDKILSYEELENQPIICLEKNTSTRTYVDQCLKEQQVVLKPEFELATSDMIVQFAKRNLGIGSVVKEFAKDLLETGDVFQLQFQQSMKSRDICIVTSDKNPTSLAAKKLLEMMV